MVSDTYLIHIIIIRALLVFQMGISYEAKLELKFLTECYTMQSYLQLSLLALALLPGHIPYFLVPQTCQLLWEPDECCFFDLGHCF